MPSPRHITVPGILTLLALSSAPAWSDCTCRYNGGETSEHGTVCIKTAKGRELAVCEKVLNVTSWKFLGQSCPSAVNDGQPVSMPKEQVQGSG